MPLEEPDSHRVKSLMHANRIPITGWCTAWDTPACGAPEFERCITARIYRLRPGVRGGVRPFVCVIPFAMTRNRLRPVFHLSGFQGSASAHFDIPDAVDKNRRGGSRRAGTGKPWQARVAQRHRPPRAGHVCRPGVVR